MNLSSPINIAAIVFLMFKTSFRLDIFLETSSSDLLVCTGIMYVCVRQFLDVQWNLIVMLMLGSKLLTHIASEKFLIFLSTNGVKMKKHSLVVSFFVDFCIHK